MFEGGLIAGALVLGLLVGTPVVRQFTFSGSAAALGVAATMPLLAGLWMQERAPWGWAQSLNRSVRAIALRLFRRCTIVDLVVVSLLAGTGEEMFFRGVVQGALAQRTPVWAAVAIASVIFGIAHPVTITYGVVAAGVGVYLGLLLVVTGNLLVPTFVHVLYDFVALVYLLRVQPFRRRSVPRSS